jgi:uncharacterized HAD superfamily protein
VGFIAIDIDNVVCNFVSAMIDFTNDNLGTDYSALDVTVWDFVDSPNIDIEFDDMMKLFDEFFAKGLWESVPVYPDSKEVLDWVSDNHDFIYLTNRPAKSEEITQRYFDYHQLPYSNTHILQSYDDSVESGYIVFANGHNKSTFAENVSVDVAIDDKPQAIQEYIDQGVTCALKIEPYNHWVDYVDPNGLMGKCKDLTEFKELIKELEINQWNQSL